MAAYCNRYYYSNFQPRSEISLFNGDGVDQWLHQIECFFIRYQTAPEQKFVVAVPYLSGEAREWYRQMWLARRLSTWDNFVVDLRHRFKPPEIQQSREELFGSIWKVCEELKQTLTEMKTQNSVYMSNLSKLMSQVSSISTCGSSIDKVNESDLNCELSAADVVVVSTDDENFESALVATSKDFDNPKSDEMNSVVVALRQNWELHKKVLSKTVTVNFLPVVEVEVGEQTETLCFGAPFCVLSNIMISCSQAVCENIILSFPYYFSIPWNSIVGHHCLSGFERLKGKHLILDKPPPLPPDIILTRPLWRCGKVKEWKNMTICLDVKGFDFKSVLVLKVDEIGLKNKALKSGTIVSRSSNFCTKLVRRNVSEIFPFLLPPAKPPDECLSLLQDYNIWCCTKCWGLALSSIQQELLVWTVTRTCASIFMMESGVLLSCYHMCLLSCISNCLWLQISRYKRCFSWFYKWMLVDGARSLHILFCKDSEKIVLVWEQVARFFKEKLVSACVEMEVAMGSLKMIDRESLEYKLKHYFKPHQISEANDENVKIVVGNKLDGTVLDEWENVPLEIYAPWCGHCQFIMKLTYKKLVSAILFVDFHHLTEKSLLVLEEFSNAKIISVYDSSNFGDQWEQSCEEDSIEITMKSYRKSIFRQIVKIALHEVVSVEIQVRAADLWTFCFNICHDEWGSCLLYMKMDIISEVITMLIMVLCRFLLNFLDVLSPQFGCSDVGYECILWGFYSGGYIGSFCGGWIMNDALVHLAVDLDLRKGKFEKLCSGTENCLLAGALKFKWTKVEAKFAPTAATIFFEKELFRACEGGQIIIDYINETCDSNLGKYTALAIKEAFSFQGRVKLRREDLLNPLDTAPSTICVIGLGSDGVQLLGDLANEDVDEANRVQIANYLCISYHAISEGMIGIEAFEAKEKLYFDIMGKAQRVDSYSYQLTTNILSTSGKLDNIIMTGDGAVDDKVTNLVFLVDCISRFLKFSLPRPPEIADLEDKVDFKEGGMLRTGIIGNTRGAFVFCVTSLV